MIDIQPTLAAISEALQAYNALPEEHDCDGCKQRVRGRTPVIKCHACDKTAPVEAAHLELERDGTWRVGVRIDPASAGIGRHPHDRTKHECHECAHARGEEERIANEAAKAEEKRKKREAAAAAAEE